MNREINYIASGNTVVVYYDAELKYLGGTIRTPCIISLAEWLNQGGE